ncbi:MAG: hypothetical protein JSW47_12810 [Phycisphaerales bacterium]|nr:MAG: hypothetical protein JSW47_12810 [Phycisphaerales bacterium]
MKQQENVSVSKSVARAVSIVVVIAVFLGLAGCSRQMAKIDEQQTQLQMMVKANSLQIEDIAARLEKNQQEFNGLIESVQNNVAQVAVDVAAVADAQLKLRDTVLSNSRQLAEKIGTLGQSQEDLSAGLGRAISSVQSETRKVAADLTTVAADVTAVTAEQARLFETVQQNNQDLTNKVAVIEQIQQERQNTIGGMEDNISALAASISGLGEDVLRLQEILQSNIRELVSIAETEGQRQTEFQESIGESLQTLDNSFASLKASQNKMQSRIEQMQNDALDLRDMPAALDQLKDQLEELSRSRLPADDAGAIEYEASADTSAETNSIE